MTRIAHDRRASIAPGEWLGLLGGGQLGRMFCMAAQTLGYKVAVLDPTTFALADRALTNFTGQISEMLQGRFAGMGTSAGGASALGFAPASDSGVAGQAQAAFSGRS